MNMEQLLTELNYYRLKAKGLAVTESDMDRLKPAEWPQAEACLSGATESR